MHHNADPRNALLHMLCARERQHTIHAKKKNASDKDPML